MAYAEFTLRDVKTKFGLTTDETARLFTAVPEVAPSDRLASLLRDYTPVATAIGTEKAKSEYVVAPIMGEVLLGLFPRVSLFSGNEFPVDPADGLTGRCDFIFTRSPEQEYIAAPVLVVAEAKNDLPKNGYGQCAAGMVAAQRLNQREGAAVPVVYGASTSGSIWRFLKLEGSTLSIDRDEYYLTQVGKVIGILHHILVGPAAPAAAA